VRARDRADEGQVRVIIGELRGRFGKKPSETKGMEEGETWVS
jgi:hypothetical protein